MSETWTMRIGGCRREARRFHRHGPDVEILRLDRPPDRRQPDHHAHEHQALDGAHPQHRRPLPRPRRRPPDEQVPEIDRHAQEEEPERQRHPCVRDEADDLGQPHEGGALEEARNDGPGDHAEKEQRQADMAHGAHLRVRTESLTPM